MAKRKGTNNDIQNITQKTKDRATRTSLKTGGELMCSERVGSSCSTYATRRVTLVTNPVTSHGRRKSRILIATNGTHYILTDYHYLKGLKLSIGSLSLSIFDGRQYVSVLKNKLLDFAAKLILCELYYQIEINQLDLCKWIKSTYFC